MVSSLLLDFYELTMAQSYFVYKQDTRATFDLFVREMPENRSYLVACGLDDILNYLKNFKFSREELSFLKKQKLFSDDFLSYLGKIRFKGDLWALPEGTVFFANEPLIRVTGSIIEAQLVESYLLNTINLQTMIASKASRVVTSAAGRGVFDFSLRRTHGAGAGIKVSRASYLAGFSGTSNVLAGKLYNIPVAGTMAHSFVLSFKNELDSFLAYASVFPQKTILLVDTYNTKKGIENAVTIGIYLKEKGFRLHGIRLDSGDITVLSKFARKKLDKEGLKFVKIFATGNLDEFKITELIKKGSKVDNFGVGTNMGVSIDAPCLDVVYKMSEVSDESGKFIPTMKLSKDKVTYPGRKQVFRIKDKKGKAIKDILGLAGEKVNGRPLLKKIMQGGRVICKVGNLEEARNLARKNLSAFSAGLKEVNTPYKYPVEISPGLKKLKNSLAAALRKRQ